jgi:hypothetical protein
MQFLFPSDYFNVNKPDEGFVDQVSCFRSAGFQTSVISLENLGTSASKVIPPFAMDEPIVYRGWMLSANDYGTLVTTVDFARSVFINALFAELVWCDRRFDAGDANFFDRG